MSQLLQTSSSSIRALKHVLTPQFQSVRHRLRHKIKEPFRKPVWQPTAPSKLYRIKKKEELSESEQAQRDHLEHTYSINMKSIQEYLRQEFYLPTLEDGGRSHEDVLKEEEEQNKLLAQNDAINAKIAAERAVREKEFEREQDALLLAKQIELEEENRVKGEELDRIVRLEIERSKTYITKENLDEKIDELLTHSTSYEFAIDTNGRVVFDGSLHPYALNPKAVPETSSQTEEYKNVDTSKPVFLTSRKLF